MSPKQDDPSVSYVKPPHRKFTALGQAQGKTKPEERTGRQTTALRVEVGTHRICLYWARR